MEITEGMVEPHLKETYLWETHRDRVYRYLLRLTGEPETAADLTQETFYQAIRDLRRSRGDMQNPTAWLMRIATNRATDLFRRRRLIRWLPFLTERHGGVVDDNTESTSRRDLVAATLRRLTPEAAALLVLRDAEGFSTRELAGMLGLQEAAVRKRLSRARELFRLEYRRLKGECP